MPENTLNVPPCATKDGNNESDDENQPAMGYQQTIMVTIMCRNDELSSTMSWVGCLQKDSELFVLFAENGEILLKISVVPILLTFVVLVALNLLGNQLIDVSNSNAKDSICN